MNSTESDSSLRLIEVTQLMQLIDERNPATERPYLKNRWLHMIRWWDSRASQARRWFFRLRYVVIIGSALIPFLTSTDLGREQHWRHTASLIAVAIAACAGIESLHNWSGVWLEKRRAAELLKVEGWLFLTAAGKYKDGLAFDTFVQAVESQIAAEVGEYVKVAKPFPERDESTSEERAGGTKSPVEADTPRT